MSAVDCDGVTIEAGDLVQHTGTLGKYRVCAIDSSNRMSLWYKGEETGWYPTNRYRIVGKAQLHSYEDSLPIKKRKLMLTWNAEV